MDNTVHPNYDTPFGLFRTGERIRLPFKNRKLYLKSSWDALSTDMFAAKSGRVDEFLILAKLCTLSCVRLTNAYLPSRNYLEGYTRVPFGFVHVGYILNGPVYLRFGGVYEIRSVDATAGMWNRVKFLGVGPFPRDDAIQICSLTTK